VVRSLFLSLNQRAVHASRRSVTRSLGLAADEEMLRSSGLWHRELFYLEQVKERDLPVLEPGLPRGWRQVSSSWMSDEYISYWEGAWRTACVDHAWTAKPDFNEFSEDVKMARIREGVSPYGLGSLISTRTRRLIGSWKRDDSGRMVKVADVLPRSQAWKWVNLRSNSSVFGRVKFSRGRRVWVEVDLLVPRTQVFFLSAVE